MVQTNSRVNGFGLRISERSLRSICEKEHQMADQDMLHVYVGCYTTDEGSDDQTPGILLAGFDPAAGRFAVEASWPAPDASYLAMSADGGVLYAVAEGEKGAVSAFAVDASGHLRHLGTQPTEGAEPCHLSVHPGGTHLLTANYGSGSVAVHPLLPDGGIGAISHLEQHEGSGPDPDRQAGPHAHMATADPSGAVLSVDLGTDSVIASRLDPATGRLTTLATSELPPGSGPRHLVFHPTAPYAYVANELSGTVIVCSYVEPSGALALVAEYDAVPADAAGGTGARNYPGEILISADGRHLYVSNRGDESITLFTVARDGARLEPAGRWSCGGSWPRDLALSPDGGFLFCANQRSGSVTVFRVDQGSGALTACPAVLTVHSPARVLPR
jgi:6-phosphogluconolactonase